MHTKDTCVYVRVCERERDEVMCVCVVRVRFQARVGVRLVKRLKVL